MRVWSWAILLVAGASLAPGRPAAAGDELAKGEATALVKAERHLIELARFAAGGRDIGAALAELQGGLDLWPAAPNIPGELTRMRAVAGKVGTPDKAFGAKLAKKREAAYAAVAKALADAALAAKDAAPARYERYLGLIRVRYPSDAALQKLKVAYFAPYFAWCSPGTVKRLEAGDELHEGKWLTAAEVAKLDAAHASWNDPWVLVDDVHEVRTTLPLRKARQVLVYVGHYRRYFLERFAGLWDLQPPTGKLPVIVTATRSEMLDRMREETRSSQPPGNGAAFYLQTNGKLNPCFVSYEMASANGMVVKLERFEEILVALTHEVTHQICFEYSKHAYDPTRPVEHQFWCVEGIAELMGGHVYDGTSWRLTKPKTSPMGEGYVEGAFAWCKTHALDLPMLDAFTSLSQVRFLTAENYHIAATLAYFLVDGDGGKYRSMFCKLCETVHQVKDGPDAFGKCFPGVEFGSLREEFLKFVDGIVLDG